MADPVLHIKDSYYFEVPKFMWRQHFTSLEQVPEFLRKAHPDEPLEEFNTQLSGKILLYPQPFGTLKNLYEKESGFCISRFMVLEMFAALVLCVVFIGIARKIRTGHAPKGHRWNFLEAFLVFIRDQVARPAIGGHDADRFVPLLWTMFFFILALNLLGMIPWLGAPTGAWGTTFALAAATFATVVIAGIARFGVVGFWLNQVPHMDLPIVLAVILKPIIFVIEIVGLIIKHAVLSVRLLANMVAGHIVLLAILGLTIAAQHAANATFFTVATISIFGATAISMLELFVAFLQAYVFTFLSALFIGAAIHHH
jgi:F-type H+-transporting ATPase subunit a